MFSGFFDFFNDDWRRSLDYERQRERNRDLIAARLIGAARLPQRPETAQRQRRAGELAQQRLTRAWWADTLRWQGQALPAAMLGRLAHAIDTEHHPTE